MLTAAEAAEKALLVKEKEIRENLVQAQKRRITARRNALIKKKDFLKEFKARAADSIAWSVDHGLFSTTLSLSAESFRTFVEADEATKNHFAFKELKAFAKRLQKQGYSVDFFPRFSTYTTQHESSVPDYSYTESHPSFNVGWGKKG